MKKRDKYTIALAVDAFILLVLLMMRIAPKESLFVVMVCIVAAVYSRHYKENEKVFLY
jgi:hypothetical protein